MAEQATHLKATSPNDSAAHLEAPERTTQRHAGNTRGRRTRRSGIGLNWRRGERWHPKTTRRWPDHPPPGPRVLRGAAQVSLRSAYSPFAAEIDSIVSPLGLHAGDACAIVFTKWSVLLKVRGSPGRIVSAPRSTKFQIGGIGRAHRRRPRRGTADVLRHRSHGPLPSSPGVLALWGGEGLHCVKINTAAVSRHRLVLKKKGTRWSSVVLRVLRRTSLFPSLQHFASTSVPGTNMT